MSVRDLDGYAKHRNTVDWWLLTLALREEGMDYEALYSQLFALGIGNARSQEEIARSSTGAIARAAIYTNHLRRTVIDERTDSGVTVQVPYVDRSGVTVVRTMPRILLTYRTTEYGLQFRSWLGEPVKQAALDL